MGFMPSCQRDSTTVMSNPIVIIGPGRLGHTAEKILKERGHSVTLIGRGVPIPEAEITWLTVPDREIESVASAVPSAGVLLHASGALDWDVLKPRANIGSLHPLMTFPGLKGAEALPSVVPAAISGDPTARPAARMLAEKLGFTPFDFDGDRAAYHSAAVMAGNFATTLLVTAGRVLSSCDIPQAQARALLAPLAIQSLNQAIAHGAKALTGPIARGDESIVKLHTQALTELDPELAKLYLAMASATRALKP
jgi:predicted short-subunit dehydrogenase-like oxidoreductase (DUF2520 family)